MEARKQAPDLPANRRSQQDRLWSRGVERIAAAFERAGWKVQRPRRGAPDLMARRRGRTYAVEIKAAAGRARRASLQALMADAILQSRSYAEEAGASPLAIVVAPSLSDAIVAELEEYVRRHANGIAWGIADERGGFRLHGPDLEDVGEQRLARSGRMRPAGSRPSVAHVPNPFSDLGQWMLKVLLAPGVPEAWLSARREDVRGVGDLADLADVSPASASKFLSALNLAGHLAPQAGVVRLSRIPALLDSWQSASRRPCFERPARLILPSGSPLEHVRSVLGARASSAPVAGPQEHPVSVAGERGRRACLALFAACDELGLGIVRGAPVHIYTEDLSDEFLAQLGLHPVDRDADADVIVRRPHVPESVFRACVRVGAVPVADAVQCWLDVAFHPARGAEQADEIARRLKLEEWKA